MSLDLMTLDATVATAEANWGVVGDASSACSAASDAGTGVVAMVLAMVKLVAFTSPAAPATASMIGEVSLPDGVGIADACAEAAIAAAAMLSGGAEADPEAADDAAGVGVAVVGGAVTAVATMADGSTGTSGAEAGAATSEVCLRLASAGSSEVFPDLVCFDGFPVA
ncbi:hypothetical protein ACWX0K_00395 [Nitrobacteraceae bacterium UC4446_H13]